MSNQDKKQKAIAEAVKAIHKQFGSGSIMRLDGSDVQENCGVSHFGGAFGNGTGNPYAKKSYQLKFRKELGAAKLSLPLFAGFDHGFLAQDSFDPSVGAKDAMTRNEPRDGVIANRSADRA